ncbi:hypothetical protein JC525_19645 [Alteromonas sp. IB21]|uniref:hypothetical protein n=1 Tax=Alteromonas sp. IB21 TaxID=2779369 RepID=UPI0018E789E3|nr:hypothetical protein [Alteromonas sp. IB21]MBJ2131131.1 hypothetical protein [Alteromonas sp. IB21]
MKLMSIGFFLAILVSFSKLALSSEVVECYDCSHSDKIVSWGMLNLKVGEKKHITLVDIYNKNARSFDVTLSLTPSLPGMPEVPIVTYMLSSVPSGISTMMTDLSNASNSLVAEAEAKSIPKEVISSPWEFVNCSYCRADVSDYLNNSLEGKIKTVEATAISIAQALNLINTSVPNQFQIPLETGGSILVELTVINSPIKLEVKILRILDTNNNEVQQDVTKLNNMNIKAALEAHIEDMNNYLSPLGYGVNMNSLIFSRGFYRGRITIERFDYK